MDLEGIMINEVSQTEINTIWSHLYVEPRKNQWHQTHLKRDQICSYQKWEVGEEGGAGGGWSKGTHFWLWDKYEQCNVQHENYS